MNNISEEEIIEIIEKLQCEYKEQQNDKKYNEYTVFKAKEYLKGLQGLLDLYKKEKEKNKELKEEKVLNEKILYFANNTLCNYQEGYQGGLHKEIVAEERERFIIGQEIKRLKDTIHKLHNHLDEGNKRVKEGYIPKSKIKE